MFPKRWRLLRVSLLIVLILNSFTNGSTQNSNGSLYAGVENESTDKGTFSQSRPCTLFQVVVNGDSNIFDNGYHDNSLWRCQLRGQDVEMDTSPSSGLVKVRTICSISMSYLSLKRRS